MKLLYDLSQRQAINIMNLQNINNLNLGIRNTKNIFTTFCFSIFISIMLFFPSPIYAQTISLSTTPPIVQGIIKPGKSILVAFTVQNHGDPVVLVPSVLPFRPNGKNGDIAIQKTFSGPLRFSLQNDDERYALEKEFLLDSGKSVQLLVKISVPGNTEENDYYYTFLVSSKNPQNEQSNSGSVAQAAIGSNIILTVSKNGESILLPSIENFGVEGGINIGNLHIFDSFTSIPVRLVVENRGKNVFSPEGKIQMKNNFGGRANFDIVPQNILSMSSRQLTATPSANIDNHIKNPTLLLKGFFIGWYDLATTITVGGGNKTLYANTRFFAFPFTLMIVLITCSFILYLARKRANEH